MPSDFVVVIFVFFLINTTGTHFYPDRLFNLYIYCKDKYQLQGKLQNHKGKINHNKENIKS